jgi:eukaryotic-like serine/threonine-protein kinase
VLNAGLPSIACTWLDVVSVTGSQNGVSVVLRGVAGNPAVAQTAVNQLLLAKAIKVTSIDSTDVAPIQGSECGPLEAFRQIRSISQDGISVPQRQFEMSALNEGEFKGSVGAKAVINFDFSNGAGDYALFGLEPSGMISEEAKTKDEITTGFTPISKDRYRLEIYVTHTGWSGLLLLSGRKPISAGFVAGPAGSRNAAWTQRFLSAAKVGGWKAEMVWFKTVDEQPN